MAGQRNAILYVLIVLLVRLNDNAQYIHTNLCSEIYESWKQRDQEEKEIATMDKTAESYTEVDPQKEAKEAKKET